MPFLLPVLFLSLALGIPARAELTGTIQGRLVIEGTQMTPQGARVTAAGIVIDVSDDGTYVMGPLREGTYELTAEWPEVGKLVKTDVKVLHDDELVLDFVFPPPKPVILSIFPPVVNRVRPVSIHGDHFLHAAKGSLEVLIGGKIVTATRLSNELIEVRNEAIGQLFKQIGTSKSAVELPLQIKVNGLASNEAKFALYNITPGNIQVKVATDNTKVPLTGAQLEIPLRNLRQKLPANGAFVFSKIPPRPYLVTLDWPAAGVKTDQKLEVLPGQTATVTFQVKIPPPQLKSSAPEVVERPAALMLRGRHLFHSAKAPYEVKMNDRPVPTTRISDQIIQVGEIIVGQIWKTVRPGETVERTFTVQVAGQKSQPLIVKFKGPPSPTQSAERAVATEEKKQAK